MKDQDNLFYEGDPFDDPLWKAAGTTKTAKTGKTGKTTSAMQDFVGCPLAWVKLIWPHVQGEGQLMVALLLYRRWALLGRKRTFDHGDLKKLGIDRAVKHRALAKLKDAGLIAVGQRNGRAIQIIRRWK